MIPAGLLREVLDNPDDDSPRLILADYLEENGEPERGEFIRIQCALANIDHFRVGPSYKQEKALQRRERELLDGHEREWSRELNGISPCRWQFNRGFVELVTCTTEAWLAHADMLTACQPIRKVRLTTCHEDSYISGGFRKSLLARWPRVKDWEVPERSVFLGLPVYAVDSLPVSYQRGIRAAPGRNSLYQSLKERP